MAFTLGSQLMPNPRGLCPIGTSATDQQQLWSHPDEVQIDPCSWWRDRMCAVRPDDIVNRAWSIETDCP